MDAIAKQRIGILGAGPTTLFLLHELLARNTDNLDIIIFEAGDTVGSGKAFNYRYSFPGLLSNINRQEMPVLGLKFSSWLKRTSPAPAYQDDTVLPRAVIGQYLADNFWFAVDKLRARGVGVSINCNTQVADSRHSDTGYTLITEDGSRHDVDTLIINTGPAQEKRHKQHGVYPPYPIFNYDKPELTVFQIIGTSLTAIDVAVGLAQLRGYFIRNNSRLSYRTNMPFTLTMQSPSGLLPQPWFSVTDKKTFLRFMKAQYPDCDNTLDAYYEAVCLPALAEFAPHAYEQVRNLTLKASLTFLAGKKSPVDAVTKLRCELIGTHACARQAYENWPAVIEAFFEYVERYGSLTDDDVYFYHQNLRPLVAACTGAIPLAYCEKLLALVSAGILTITSASYSDTTVTDHVEPDTAATVDCRGFPGPLATPLPLTSLAIVEGKQTEAGSTSVTVRHTTRHFELLIDGKPAGVFIGSPHLLPSVISVPGLDSCAWIASRIADAVCSDRTLSRAG